MKIDSRETSSAPANHLPEHRRIAINQLNSALTKYSNSHQMLQGHYRKKAEALESEILAASQNIQKNYEDILHFTRFDLEDLSLNEEHQIRSKYLNGKLTAMELLEFLKKKRASN